jgi:hypothetical protein
MTTPGSPLSRQQVQDLHRNDDVDTRAEAHHHTLGNGRNQSSPGYHNHDGQNSSSILSGVTFTGSRTNATAIGIILNDICNALAQLGATNNTSA